MLLLDKNSRKVLKYLINKDEFQDAYNVAFNVKLSNNDDNLLQLSEKALAYLLEANCITVAYQSKYGHNVYRVTNYGKHYYKNVILNIIKTLILSVLIPFLIAYLTSATNCDNCSNVTNQNRNANLQDNAN